MESSRTDQTTALALERRSPTIDRLSRSCSASRGRLVTPASFVEPTFTLFQFLLNASRMVQISARTHSAARAHRAVSRPSRAPPGDHAGVGRILGAHSRARAARD